MNKSIKYLKEKIYKNKLQTCILVAAIIYLSFFIWQNNFAQSFKDQKGKISKEIKKENKKIDQDSTNLATLKGLQENDVEFSRELKSINESLKTIELKTDLMEKYVEASQKNLDLWLKLLTFILALLIGYSIFTGLKTRELARDELAEIRRLRDAITKEAGDAEDRLKAVKADIKEIEDTADNAKKIEEKMSNQLKEFSVRTDIALDEGQRKKLDEVIEKTKSDLHDTSIENLKNIFFAKAVKAHEDKKWDDVIRLTTNYIDLDPSNASVFLRRALAINNSNITYDKKIYEKALSDDLESVRLNPTNKVGANNLAVTYHNLGRYEEAIKEYSRAIAMDSEVALYYKNRAMTYRQLNKITEAENDEKRLAELEK